MPGPNSDSNNGNSAAIAGGLHIIGDVDEQFLEGPYRAIAQAIDLQLDAGQPPEIVAIAAMHVAFDIVARLKLEDDFAYMRDRLERDLLPALESHRQKWIGDH